ncbi:unnamed protein product [Arabidopsis lyrata]|nr:unnamed protein product [Arabidopsis lyrata]
MIYVGGVPFEDENRSSSFSSSSQVPPEMRPPTMEKQPHQDISAYGREPPMNVHVSSAPPMVAQIPLPHTDTVIGTSGSNKSYTRLLSGATVTSQETRGLPCEMTVEVSRTGSQVQTAMAEAGALAPAHGSAMSTTISLSKSGGDYVLILLEVEKNQQVWEDHDTQAEAKYQQVWEDHDTQAEAKNQQVWEDHDTQADQENLGIWIAKSRSLETLCEEHVSCLSGSQTVNPTEVVTSSTSASSSRRRTEDVNNGPRTRSRRRLR